MYYASSVSRWEIFSKPLTNESDEWYGLKPEDAALVLILCIRSLTEEIRTATNAYHEALGTIKPQGGYSGTH